MRPSTVDISKWGGCQRGAEPTRLIASAVDTGNRDLLHVRRPIFEGNLLALKQPATGIGMGAHHGPHIYAASGPAALCTFPEFGPNPAVVLDEAHDITSVKNRTANNFGFHITNLHTIHGEECVELYENCQAR